jgi:hypothetical protein
MLISRINALRAHLAESASLQRGGATDPRNLPTAPRGSKTGCHQLLTLPVLWRPRSSRDTCTTHEYSGGWA